MKHLLLCLLCSISITASSSEVTIQPVERLITLGTHNTVNLRGEINDEMVDVAIKKVLDMDAARKSNTTIFLVIDSPGGSISAGESFIEAVKTVRNLQTITINAASMASAIVQALKGQRLMLASGMQMYHRAQGQVSGYFEDGEIESRLAFIKSVVRTMEKRSADRMGISLQAYKDKVRNEWWMSAEQSMQANAADEIVSIKCTPELMAAKEAGVLSVLFMQIPIEQSACPLLKGFTVTAPTE